MPAYGFLWTDEIVNHLAEHGISQDSLRRLFADRTARVGAVRRICHVSGDMLMMAGIFLPCLKNSMR
jgi:hypothetical protein